MPLTHLEHVLILAKDLEATKTFYEDLGLRVGDRPPFPFPGHWLYLGDTPCIHLAAARGSDGEDDYIERSGGSGETGNIDHVAFVATGLEEVVARLESQGLEMRRRTVPLLNVEQIFIKDPNGVTVELNFPMEKTG